MCFDDGAELGDGVSNVSDVFGGVEELAELGDWVFGRYFGGGFLTITAAAEEGVDVEAGEGLNFVAGTFARSDFRGD